MWPSPQQLDYFSLFEMCVGLKELVLRETRQTAYSNGNSNSNSNNNNGSSNYK